MNKSILLSIRPQWVAKILNGEKTIEIRRKFPKNYVGWVYIYCTKNGGKYYRRNEIPYHKASCLSLGEMNNYLQGNNAYALHISQLEIFDKPKELREFYKLDSSYNNMFGWCANEEENRVYLTRPPQNYCYIEENN